MGASDWEQCEDFDWDEANAGKIWERHEVTPEEAEQLFFERPIVARSDVRHSRGEKRYYALGQTSRGRLLFVAFTIRGKMIRVISARDMNRQESEAYRNYEENWKEDDSD